MLTQALLDPLNQRFQFLCEKAIPLYSPAVVYREMFAVNRSAIAACRQEVC